jgi:predicted RNA-binding protein YlxR (DUF448 family)
MPKRALIRLVRTPEGVQIDPTGKLPGRGAYLHENRACWQNALKKDTLARALKTKLTPEDRERLEAFMNSLPMESEDSPQNE